MSDFHTSETPVAAKPYHCEECAAPILKGERYRRSFGKYDGAVYSYRCCLTCDALWHAAWEFCDWYDPEEGPPIGELRTYLLAEHGIADASAWLIEWKAQKAAERVREDAPPWMPEDLAASLVGAA